MNPQCVPIEIVGDVLIENDESFTVTLTTEDPLVTVTSADASVTILNDDGRCLLIIVFLQRTQYTLTDCS